MIEAHINTFLDVPSTFDVLLKDYIKSIDECLQKALNKFYAKEIYGLDSRKELKSLTMFQNIFFALTMYAEQKDIDIYNNVDKTIEEYKTMFHLNCPELENTLICSNCNSELNLISNLIISYPGEFSDDFDDSFLN